jgi:hypothetical protein
MANLFHTYKSGVVFTIRGMNSNVFPTVSVFMLLKSLSCDACYWFYHVPFTCTTLHSESRDSCACFCYSVCRLAIYFRGIPTGSAILLPAVRGISIGYC